MSMSVFFADIWATAIVIPGILMCLIPLHSKLRIRLSHLLPWYIPVICGLCVLSAYVECSIGIMGNSISFFLLLTVLCVSAFAMLDLPPLKTLYMISLIVATMSFGGISSYMLDGFFYPEASPIGGYLGLLGQWIFSLVAMVLFCTAFAGKIVWILDNFHLNRIWSIAWLTPAVIAVINVMMVPKHYANIHVGRVYSVMILIIIVNFFIFVISQVMFFIIARSTVEHYEDLNAIQLLSIQASQYEALRDYVEYIRHMRHDFKHTIRTLSIYAEQHDYEALCSYLNQYDEELSTGGRRFFFCSHCSTNAVLSYYASIADEYNIRTDWRVDVPADIPLNDTLLSIVFGNLAENAIEACRKIPEKERFIKLYADTQTEGCLYITMSNSFDGIVNKSGNEFVSTKKNGQNPFPSGIGLKSVKKAAAGHDGSTHFYHKGNTFYCDVMLRFEEGKPESGQGSKYLVTNGKEGV